MKKSEFIQMVKDDISRCEETLEMKQGATELLDELVGKYSNVSKNFPYIEMNPLLLRHHPEVAIGNIRAIRGFLNTYLLNGCEDYKFNDTKSSEINVITSISNTNENNIYIGTFSEAKSKIENMTSLSDSEIEEILSKIDRLEDIVNSSDRKSKKWENAKGIIKWIADKGIDVGLTLLPLILKLG